MRRDTQALAATMVGAVVGGLTAYLLFSERGRAWRRQLQPRLEDLMREFQELRGTVSQASSAMSDGWRSLDEVAADVRSRPSDAEPMGRSRQVHPF